MARITVRFDGAELAGEPLPDAPAEGLVRTGQELELVGTPVGLRSLGAVCQLVAGALDAELARRHQESS